MDIAVLRKRTIFAPRYTTPGRLAEWLGRGLQNLVQQFESATDLTFDYAIGYTLADCIFLFLFSADSRPIFLKTLLALRMVMV